jgi:hypothetical protein
MENLLKIDLNPLFSQAENHYNFKEDQEPCIICERPVNINAKTKWIHMTTSLEAVERNYDQDDSQGCFPIGNDCCKKLPKNLVFEY